MSIKGSSTKASVLRWDEVEHLYKVAYANKNFDLCKFITASSNYGLKITEIFELTWEDVLSDTFFVKSRSGLRTVKNTKEAKEKFEHLYVIDKFSEKKKHIMTGKRGKNLSVQRLNVKLKELNTVSNLHIKNLSTESFRKAFARHVYDSLPGKLLNSGRDMLMKYLGHSSQKVTMEYMGFDDDFEFSNLYEVLSFIENRQTQVVDEEFSKEYAIPSYVYLMKDSNLPLYLKIGKSNNVSSRERTLQGEKPTISLYKYLKFDGEKQAYAFEKKLHNIYKEYNARGEWYILPEKELNDLLNQYEWVDAVS